MQKEDQKAKKRRAGVMQVNQQKISNIDIMGDRNIQTSFAKKLVTRELAKRKSNENPHLIHKLRSNQRYLLN